MGGSNSVLGLDFSEMHLTQLTQEFARWTMKDVRALYAAFRRQIFGFAMVEAQFESILSARPSLLDNVDITELFNALDNDDDGRIDGLELLGGLALCCKASFEKKARFCFELFDFNLNASLSKDEMVMMMQSSVCGVLCLTAGSEDMEPSHEQFAALAEEAFARADTDKSGQITYEEFAAWARSNREIMSCMAHLSRVANVAVDDAETEDSASEASLDPAEFEVDVDIEALMNADRKEVASAKTAPEASLPDATKDGRAGAGGGVSSVAGGSGAAAGDSNEGEMAAMMDTGGDQSVAPSARSRMESWTGDVHEPSNYVAPPYAGEAPDTNLELEWVHGYRAHDSRNNLRYLGDVTVANQPPPHRIVYPAAALGVVYDMRQHKQTFYQGHTDDVLSLAVHPNGHYVATGQIGPKPSIHVWDANTMECLAELSGFHRNGVSHLVFSTDGQLLASVGLDDDHSLAVYNWQNQTLEASGSGCRARVFGIAFSSMSNTCAIVGDKVVKFFNTDQRALKGKNGIIGRHGKIQKFLCVAFIDDDAVVGTASGEIYRFVNRRMTQHIRAHGVNEPVLALYYNTALHTLVSGGKDHLVKTFDRNLKEVGSAIDLAEDLDGDGQADNESAEPSPVSLQHCQNAILIGTRGSDIFLVTAPNTPTDMHTVQRLVSGHFSKEVWGLATHPTRGVFATAGDDKFVRIWSIRTREQTGVRKLPEACRTLCYHPSGQLLALGLQDGSMAVLNNDDLKAVTSWRHATREVTAIRYSRNAQFLAVGSRDQNIYLYSSMQDGRSYRRHAVCRGHSASICHIDFSANSKFLQSVCAAPELLFWDTRGNQVKASHRIRDEHWQTWTCTLGWPVQGIWPPEADPTDINAVDGSNLLGVLATGDDFGRVKLFRFPCVRQNALYQSYAGHASHVTNVRFTHNFHHLISTGGNDKCVFQWKHEMEEFDSGEDTASESEAEVVLEETVINTEASAPVRSALQEAANLSKTSQELAELVAINTANGGDEMMAVKPWLGALVEPSKGSEKISASCTDVDLDLQFVMGYRAHDCRNNLHYTAGGDVVYPAAALGIVYSKATQRQQFLQGHHTDDIISLTLHPVGKLVASGEVGRMPKILVWDVETREVRSVLKGFHTRGISLLAFNGTGSLLASIGLDNDHSLALYDWSKQRLLTTSPTDKGKVLGMCFVDLSRAAVGPDAAHGGHGLDVDDGAGGGGGDSGAGRKPRGGRQQQPRVTASLRGTQAIRGREGGGSDAGGGAGGSGIGGDGERGSGGNGRGGVEGGAGGKGGAAEMIVTCGKQHIKFWTPHGRNLKCQKGLWGSYPRKTIMTVTGSCGFVFSGTLDGDLYVWDATRYRIVFIWERSKTNLSKRRGGKSHKQTAAAVAADATAATASSAGTDAGGQQTPNKRSGGRSARKVSSGANDSVTLPHCPHNKAIFAMHLNQQQDLLVTGDRAGVVVVWNIDYDALNEAARIVAEHGSDTGVGARKGRPSLSRLLNGVGIGVAPVCVFNNSWSRSADRLEPVRALSVREEGLVIGTQLSSIYEVMYKGHVDRARASHELMSSLTFDQRLGRDAPTSEDVVVRSPRWYTLVGGHSDGELWGLAAHPSLDSFATSGDDATVRVWGKKPRVSTSAIATVPLFVGSLPEKSRAVAYRKHASDTHLAVAMNDGRVWVLRVDADGLPIPLETADRTEQRPNGGGHQAAAAGADNISEMDDSDGVGADDDDDGFYSSDALTSSSDDGESSFGESSMEDPGGAAAGGGAGAGESGKGAGGGRAHDRRSRRRRRPGGGTGVKTVFADASDYAVHQLAVASRWIQDMKYSADGAFLAVGSHDCNIYVHRTDETYSPYGVCSGHSSYISHLDFSSSSTTSTYLQSNCGGYELLFWNLSETPTPPARAKGKSGKPLYPRVHQVTHASGLRDEKWDTWTCALGWPVQGIWPAQSDGTDINALDRSHSFREVPVVAVADDFGRVRLFNYPCVIPGSADKCYKGHSSHVTDLKFTHDDNYLLSVGGNDKCLFVWHTDCLEEQQERLTAKLGAGTDMSGTDISTEYATGMERTDASGTEDTGASSGGAPFARARRLYYSSAPDSADDSAGGGGVGGLVSGVGGGANATELETKEELEERDELMMHIALAKEMVSGGDEFMAVKPWRGAVSEPSNWKTPTDHAQPPDARLDLEFVYGYRSQDCRNNLRYGDSTTEIVYHTAAVGIHYDMEEHTQIYNLDHDDDIISMAVHPEGHTVATGEIGRRPKIIVWDSNSGSMLQSISGFHRRGVCQLAFSGDGSRLASVGLDDDHSIAVYLTENGHLLSTGKGSRSKILCLALFGNESMVTGGDKHVKFWELVGDGGELPSKKGIFGGQVKNTTALSVAYLSRDAVTGMADGKLLLWKNRSVSKKVKAHEGPVLALDRVDDAGHPQIVSGGKDGKVKVWDAQVACVWAFDLKQSTIPSEMPVIRSVCIKANKLLIGTIASEIYEVDTALQTVHRLMQAHYRGETWGLATHPRRNHYATSGDEGTVRVWDASTHQMIRMVNLGNKVRAVAYSYDGSHIAGGLEGGQLVVYDEMLETKLADQKVAKSWIQAIAYSPNGSQVAVGAHDQHIYLLNANTYNRMAVCRGHSSYITHVDWSADSRYLQSNCGAYELLFWSNDGKQERSASSLRDVDWHTWTCTLGWPVQGIWPKESDGTDINAVHRGGNLLVSGDDFGKVRLFRYPCCDTDMTPHIYTGHASHVTNVRFTKDNRFAVSTGGGDRTVMQWALQRSNRR